MLILYVKKHFEKCVILLLLITSQIDTLYIHIHDGNMSLIIVIN
jgi:hypothetical protein